MRSQLMMSIARGLFPRAEGKEAAVALSAVIAGIIGSLATVATIIMIALGQ